MVECKLIRVLAVSEGSSSFAHSVGSGLAAVEESLNGLRGITGIDEAGVEVGLAGHVGFGIVVVGAAIESVDREGVLTGGEFVDVLVAVESTAPYFAYAFGNVAYIALPSAGIPAEVFHVLAADINEVACRSGSCDCRSCKEHHTALEVIFQHKGKN